MKGECKKNFSRTLFKVNNVQMTTITKSRSVSFSFLSRPTDPVHKKHYSRPSLIRKVWDQKVVGLVKCSDY